MNPARGRGSDARAIRSLRARLCATGLSLTAAPVAPLIGRWSLRPAWSC